MKIATTESPQTLFRGIGVVASGAGPAHALYFSCYEMAKNFLSGGNRSNVLTQGNKDDTYLYYCCCCCCCGNDCTLKLQDAVQYWLHWYMMDS